MLTEMTSRDPVPGPAETLQAMVGALCERRQGDYDLTKISMTAWAEALRRPAMRDFAYHFYAKVTGVFTALAQRWKSAAMLPADADAAAVASLFVSLMPGLIVLSHLYELPNANTLATGIRDVASALAPPTAQG